MKTQEEQFQEALADGENCPEDCVGLVCVTSHHPYGETTAAETFCDCVCDVASDCARAE